MALEVFKAALMGDDLAADAYFDMCEERGTTNRYTRRQMWELMREWRATGEFAFLLDD